MIIKLMRLYVETVFSQTGINPMGFSTYIKLGKK